MRSRAGRSYGFDARLYWAKLDGVYSWRAVDRAVGVPPSSLPKKLAMRRRDQEVSSLCARGMSYGAVGAALGISTERVRQIVHGGRRRRMGQIVVALNCLSNLELVYPGLLARWLDSPGEDYAD